MAPSSSGPWYDLHGVERRGRNGEWEVAAELQLEATLPIVEVDTQRRVVVQLDDGTQCRFANPVVATQPHPNPLEPPPHHKQSRLS